MSKNRLMSVSEEAHKKIKVAASKEGKTITKYLDDLVKVDKDEKKLFKSKSFGGGLF